MDNAHLRFGTLRFYKVTHDTTLDVRLWMDRLILEPTNRGAVGSAHLVSVFGGDQDVAAMAAAILDKATLQVAGPEVPTAQVSLGEDARVFRATIAVPGRKRPLRHVVAVSKELAQTQPGADLQARRTIVCSDDPMLVLHRIGVRFGLPVLPEWSDWFWHELQVRHALQQITGLGCRPVLVNGTRKRFLGWIGHALKRNQIFIPDRAEVPEWTLASWFPRPDEDNPALASE